MVSRKQKLIRFALVCTAAIGIVACGSRRSVTSSPTKTTHTNSSTTGSGTGGDPTINVVRPQKKDPVPTSLQVSGSFEKEPSFSSHGDQEQLTSIFAVKIQNLRMEPSLKRKLLLTQATSLKILSPDAGRCELGQKTILSLSEGGTTTAQFVGTDQPESNQNVDCANLLKNMKSEGFTVEFTNVPVDYLGEQDVVAKVTFKVSP